MPITETGDRVTQAFGMIAANAALYSQFTLSPFSFKARVYGGRGRGGGIEANLPKYDL